MNALPSSPESTHQKARLALSTKIAPKNTAAASGARSTSPARAGVQSMSLIRTATTSTDPPISRRSSLRIGRSISSSWAIALSGRTSTASIAPVRT